MSTKAIVWWVVGIILVVGGGWLIISDSGSGSSQGAPASTGVSGYGAPAGSDQGATVPSPMDSAQATTSQAQSSFQGGGTLPPPGQ